jgi:type I restriction enzyme S subunit
VPLKAEVLSDNGFKETELGPLPVEWGVVSLGDYLDLIGNGFTGQQNKDGKGYPVTRIETIAEDRINLAKVGFVENATQKQIEDFQLHPGDILFSHINSEPQLGRSVIYEGVPSVLLHGMNLLRLRTKAEWLNPLFLNYLFAFYRQLGVFVGIASRAVNQSSINQGKMRTLQIFLPPLPQQLRIARVLNTIQREIAAQDALIAAAREVKRSLMQRLFTYGPDAEPAPTKETEIGEVPEHWDVVRLEDIFDIQLGKMLSQAAKKGSSPRPYLRNANVQWGHIDLSDLYEMDFSAQEMRKFQLRRDDILVCEGGEIGRTAIWENQMPECYYQKAIHRLRPKASNILPRYFLYYMILLFLVRQVSIVEGARSTIAHLPVAKLRMLPVALPPTEEQEAIVAVLRTADCKIAAEEQHKAALQALFKSMLHQLMTGQIRLLGSKE